MTALEKALASSEIILSIIYYYVDDIETLLAIRHTCQAWFNITTAYEKSITQRLVRLQFPKARKLLEPDLYCQPYTMPWLVQLIPRQLAAILVDRHRLIRDEHMFGIPAEEPMGDALRIRVTNGFRILLRLSQISQHVRERDFPTAHAVEMSRELLPPTSTSDKVSRRLSRSNSHLRKIFSPPDVSLAKKRETLTFERRRDYIQSLSTRDREDYQIMFIFLVGCFEHLWAPPVTMQESTPDGPLDFGMPPRRWVGRKDSWANWYMLHYGPMVLWEQWWDNRDTQGRPSLFRKIEKEFSKRSKGVLNLERDFAFKIEKELQRGLEPQRYNPPPELMAYQNLWDKGPGSILRSRVPPDPLGCIGFKVDEPPAPSGMHRNCRAHLSDGRQTRLECDVITWARNTIFLRDRP